MNCDRALDALLEADLAELRGEGRSRLAAHVRSCERCSALAAIVVREMEQLQAGLGALAEANTADNAADAAINASTAAGPRPADHTEPPPRRRGRRRSRWVPQLAAALAAAAVIVLALMGRPGPERSPAPVPEELQDASGRVAVEAPADRGAAVIQTANPNITIVWLYEREES